MQRTLLILASLTIIAAGIRAAAVLVVPFLLALFLAILLTPVYFRLRRYRLPVWLSLLVVILGLAIAIFFSMTILRGSLDQFATSLPSYEVGLRRELGALLAWLESKGIDPGILELSNWYDSRSAMTYAGNLARSLSILLGQGFFIFIIAVFMIVEASGFHGKLVHILSNQPNKIGLIEHSLAAVRKYITIKSIMSLLTGVLVAVWLYLLRVDNYLFMGLLAFFLNFVPNIGSVVAAIPGILLTLVLHGPGMATIAAAGYVVINVGVSNVLEPRFIGGRLGISPLIVLISLVFWGWILGPAGMLLSVPLTMFAKILLEASPQTENLALLLGPPPLRQTGAGEEDGEEGDSAAAAGEGRTAP